MLTMFRPLPTNGTEPAAALTDLEIAACFWFWLKFSLDGEVIIGPFCVLAAATALLRFWCCF